MPVKNNKSNQHSISNTIREYVIIIGISVLVGTLISYIQCPQCDLLKSMIEGAPISLVFGLSLFKGIGWIYAMISKKFSWVEAPFKIFFFSILFAVTYTAVISTIIFLVWIIVFRGIDIQTINWPLFFNSVSIVTLISLLITLTYTSISFLRQWKDSAVQSEQLKREKLATEYQALKNQVNPHFLFNSLNTLTSLVHKNPDTATSFIKKLSDVYRYVLEHEGEEVVDLQVELEFVNSYVFLQKIRHGESLQVQTYVSDCKGKFVIPLSIQMLVENALKHNIISEDSPLHIQIFCNGSDYLEVKNNLQKRNILDERKKRGLENIRSRYAFLTSKKFVTEENDKDFIVKLPLLTINEIG